MMPRVTRPANNNASPFADTHPSELEQPRLNIVQPPMVCGRRVSGVVSPTSVDGSAPFDLAHLVFRRDGGSEAASLAAAARRRSSGHEYAMLRSPAVGLSPSATPKGATNATPGSFDVLTASASRRSSQPNHHHHTHNQHRATPPGFYAGSQHALTQSQRSNPANTTPTAGVSNPPHHRTPTPPSAKPDPTQPLLPLQLLRQLPTKCHVMLAEDATHVYTIPRRSVAHLPPGYDAATGAPLIQCAQFGRTGRCDAGDKCREAHILMEADATPTHTTHRQEDLATAERFQTSTLVPIAGPKMRGLFEWLNPTKCLRTAAPLDKWLTAATDAAAADADAPEVAASHCAHWTTQGWCHFGASCRFIHVVQPSPLLVETVAAAASADATLLPPALRVDSPAGGAPVVTAMADRWTGTTTPTTTGADGTRPVRTPATTGAAETPSASPMATLARPERKYPFQHQPYTATPWRRSPLM